MIKEHFNKKFWNSNLALYVSFMSYITQNKQNCFIDEVCMKARGRGGRSSQKRASIVLVTSFFFLKFMKERLGIKKLAYFTVSTEAATRCVLSKKVLFLEVSQNSQEKTCGRVSFIY